METILNNPIDLYEKRCARMDDEDLHSEIKIHLVVLSSITQLTPEVKHRTMTLLKEGLKRSSMSSNHEDFSITIRILNHL